MMNNTTPVSATSYTYDGMSRLATVGDGTNTATYTRATGSNLLTNTAITNGASTMLNRARTYDNVNRLTSITNSAGAVTRSYIYTLNDKDQRTKITFADGSYWDYTYDDKGQVTGGVKKDASGTAIPGFAFGYNYDDIGNRLWAEQGMPLMHYTYTSNNVNQYTQMTVPGYIPVTGKASTDAKVTVVKGSDGSVVTPTRNGEYFSTTMTVDNSSSKVTENLTINAVKYDATQEKDIVATENRTAIVNSTPQSFTYDDDGNTLALSHDGVQWNLTWNGENRMIAAESADQKIECAYDYMGRRFSKKVYTGSTGNWTLASEEKYVYDGTNRIALYNGSDTLQKTYVWGIDLSGSLSGAGGVGGLLVVTDTNSYYPMYDGNGNIVAYTDNSGNIVAEYSYDPFGRTLSQSGTKASGFAYRFSTKPFEQETGLIVYALRCGYDPTIGRWLSRDPIGEIDPNNKFNLLYGFVNNNPISFVDILGLWKKLGTINGGRRMLYEEENGDTPRKLAQKVRLKESEFDKWAIWEEHVRLDKPIDKKKPNQKHCGYSVPNVVYTIYSLNNYNIFYSYFSGWIVSENIYIRNQGYHVTYKLKPTYNYVAKALKDKDIYGFVSLSHGDEDSKGDILLYSDKLVKPSWVKVQLPYTLGAIKILGCFVKTKERAWSSLSAGYSYVESQGKLRAYKTVGGLPHGI